MLKLLFLPRGYVTIFALFWWFQNGELDFWREPDQRPTATQIVAWLSSSNQNSQSEIEVINPPDTEHTRLKSQILAELAKYERSHTSETAVPLENRDSELTGQMRSEIPPEIGDYLHKLFR